MINKNLKKIITLILCFGVCISLCSCNNEGKEKIKVAEVAHSIFYAPQYIAVKKGYFKTRQKAKYAVENACVYVENKLVDKVSKSFEENCNIEIKGEVLPFVSRGGLKLDKAINIWEINLKEKTCMDIGASTGGFTDCMLKNGASKVYAVDVGHNQLDEKLIRDERVVNLEGTNIKDIDVNSFEKVDFISVDVSFISLTMYHSPSS